MQNDHKSICFVISFVRSFFPFCLNVCPYVCLSLPVRCKCIMDLPCSMLILSAISVVVYNIVFIPA